MSRVLRLDRGVLSAPKRTPQGGFKVPAALTRTGIFEYRLPNGSVRREYRPESEVIRGDSIEGLEDAPVTLDHPPEMVTASNFRSFAVGHVSGTPSVEEGKIVANLTIQDSEAISQIEKGRKREVSCGYTCVVMETPGETESGERYDAIQTQIRYNHVALVDKGRAGKEVSLRLDSNLQLIDNPMKIELIQGVEYEIGTDAHKEACKRRDAEQARLDSEREALKAERDTLKAERDSLKERLDSEPQRLAEAVKGRVSLLSLASKHGVEVAGEDSDTAVKKKILGVISPRLDVSDASDTYIDSALDLVLKIYTPGPENLLHNQTQERNDKEDFSEDPPDVLARENMISRLKKLGNGEA